MKKVRKIVAIAFIAAVMVLSHGTVKAANRTLQIVKEGLRPSDKTLCFLNYGTTWNYAAFGIEGVEVLTVTSSNESVCKVTLGDSYSANSVHYDYLKAGKATIKATYTYKGKTYKSSAKIKVAPFVNPFKSVKVGSKNITKVFDKSKAYICGSNCTGYTKVSGKQVLNYTLKNGYKMYQDPSIQTKSNYNKRIYFKKNKKLDLSKIDYVHFYIKDKEGYTFGFGWGNMKRQ